MDFIFDSGCRLFNLAVLTQIKAVAKARDPKSPEREIQSGLNCGYDVLSKVI